MSHPHSELTNTLTDILFDNSKLAHVKKPLFSSSSNILLQQLFTNISHAERAFASTEILSFPLNIHGNGIPKGTSYAYCPTSIQKEIAKMSNVGRRYTFSIRSRTCNVFLLCSNKQDNVKRYMQLCVKQMFMWLYVASMYAPIQCSQTMNVYLYMTSLSKMLPRKGSVIERQDVNTAFTTTCKPDTEIYIFRQEEWFKTFIHETFHCMGLDFSRYDNSELDNDMLTMFPIKSDIRVYESYCEVWAELLTIMLSVYRTMRYNTGIEDINAKFPRMVQKTEQTLVNEIKHSLFQTVKILSHSKLTYKTLIDKTSKNTTVIENNYKEETPVLSYYIIKSVLLFHISDFVHWCAINNNMSIKFSNATEKNTKHKMLKYCDLIREQYANSEYITAITSTQNIIKNTPRTPGNNYAFQNLRMSITNY